MSQSGTYNDSASPLPDIETLTGDSGGAVGPTAGNINVFGVDSTTNNNNGITTVGTPGSSLLEVTLTNRITGTGTTTDGVTPVQLYSFDLGGTAGTYLFWTRVVAYNVTDGILSSYVSYRSIRTDGANGTLAGASTAFFVEESGMEDSLAENNITGNNATYDVTGVAAKTINWNVLTEYIFVS